MRKRKRNVKRGKYCIQRCGTRLEPGQVGFCSVACRHRYDLGSWGAGREPRMGNRVGALTGIVRASVDAIRHLREEE